MKQKQLSVKQRITKLTELISDSVKLGFATPLILGYKQQLTTLQQEDKRDKEKGVRLRK